MLTTGPGNLLHRLKCIHCKHQSSVPGTHGKKAVHRSLLATLALVGGGGREGGSLKLISQGGTVSKTCKARDTAYWLTALAAHREDQGPVSSAHTGNTQPPITPVTPVSKDPAPPSDPHRHQAHTVHICICKRNTHTHQVEINTPF